MAVLKSANEFYFHKRTTIRAKKISSTILVMGAMAQTAMMGSPFTAHQILCINFTISITMVIAAGISNMFKEEDELVYPDPSLNTVPDVPYPIPFKKEE